MNEWNAKKEEIKNKKRNVIQIWENLTNNFIIRNYYFRKRWNDWSRALKLLYYKEGEKVLDYSCGAGSSAKWALAKFNRIKATLAKLEGFMTTDFTDFLKWRFGKKSEIYTNK